MSLDNTILTAHTMIPVILVLGLLNFLMLKVFRVTLTKKHAIAIVLITLALIGLSFFVSTSDYSGTGISTKYGWPHFMFQVWESTEDTSKMGSFSFLYLALNGLLVGGLVMLVTAVVVKLTKPERPAKISE